MIRNSKVILAKNIRFDREMKNVCPYTQDFMIKVLYNPKYFVAEKDNYSFLREKQSIFVDFSYEECRKANYIAFQNPDYLSNPYFWIFAFIDKINYISNKTTEIVYTIDYWHTFYEFTKFQACYVEREHVTDDTIGKNTIDEGITVGNLISDYTTVFNEIGAESFYWLVIASNYDPSDDTKVSGIGSYAGYPQGSLWFAFLINSNTSAGISEASDWINSVAKKQQAEAIQSVFALPYQAFSLSQVDSTTHLVKSANKLSNDTEFTKETIRAFRDGFTPKNKKLYVYPYNFIRITNNVGGFNDYHIEDFEGDNVVFNFCGVPCLGYSGKVRPKNYKGFEYNEDEGISLGKYPILSWANNNITNKLAQNSLNIASAILGVGSGFASQNVFTAGQSVYGLGGAILSMITQQNNAQGNVNSGDVAFSQNILRFKLTHMRPKKEFLQKIDDYFTRYGYRINLIKKPNFKARKVFTYCQIGATENCAYCDFDSKISVPSEALVQINNALRRGITIWQNDGQIGDFSLDNSII